MLGGSADLLRGARGLILCRDLLLRYIARQHPKLHPAGRFLCCLWGWETQMQFVRVYACISSCILVAVLLYLTAPGLCLGAPCSSALGFRPSLGRVGSHRFPDGKSLSLHASPVGQV